MNCTKTGRAIVFGTDTVHYGDEYTCPTCTHSVVYSNSGKPSVWPGALARLIENASDQRLQGLTVDDPISLSSKPPQEVETAKPIRDLNSFTQAELESMLFAGDPHRSTLHLKDKLREQEIINLFNHPNYEKFDSKFREMIFSLLSDMLAKDLEEMKKSEQGGH